jgi:hypothetical protein
MLNTEKWTTEGDIPMRKNLKGFHKAIWPMDNPPRNKGDNSKFLNGRRCHIFDKSKFNM